ncbi:hypothetical protein [Acinetobacter bereziniae]|uniref:hypothetical protein n=1 Tax=Acinetobacter bereziniae TaxID=106648 RepID=UPI00148F2DD3|nr:hypothetical protein [Acinetobacter bereziniae]
MSDPKQQPPQQQPVQQQKPPRPPRVEGPALRVAMESAEPEITGKIFTEGTKTKK